MNIFKRGGKVSEEVPESLQELYRLKYGFVKLQEDFRNLQNEVNNLRSSSESLERRTRVSDSYGGSIYNIGETVMANSKNINTLVITNYLVLALVLFVAVLSVYSNYNKKESSNSPIYIENDIQPSKSLSPFKK